MVEIHISYYQFLTILTCHVTVPQSISLQYGNFTTGIKDTSVFDIPDYCNEDLSTFKCTPYQWQAVANVKFGEGSGAWHGKLNVSVDFIKRIEAYDGYAGPDENGSNKRFKLVKIFDQVGMTLKPSLSIFLFVLPLCTCNVCRLLYQLCKNYTVDITIDRTRPLEPSIYNRKR